MALTTQHLLLLANRHVVLASASPRRSELLRQIGLQFDVIPSTFAEDLDKASSDGAAGYARATSRAKAVEVAARTLSRFADLIISADTVVAVDGDVLEKPADAEDATRMLQRLSGRRHSVHTGVTLVLPRRDASPALVRCFSETTEVTFAPLSAASVESYVEGANFRLASIASDSLPLAGGEPFGKAGAYAIQGAGGAFVSSITGCYSNVVGLPLHRTCHEIACLLDAGALT